ncbi:MAG: ligase-associated DNA damage response DEXH box helicase [Bacteroidota bacterium]|nr:ligase-associated DNA damage response DEXH box helicase [Bacteroidota bacterium]
MPTKKSDKYKIAEDWFEARSWKVFDFQKEVWEAYLDGKSGLLNAPTGSGKTYALWIPCLLEYIKNPQVKGLQVIWITPLRALAKDIQKAMQSLCREWGIPWNVGLRTGDTSAAERQKQKKNMPECIITTPESLHLLISQPEKSNIFKDLKCIVTDEWHEILGTKRAVQVELALSCIKNLTSKPLKIWGISATIGNLYEALEVLLGKSSMPDHVIIKANIEKKIIIRSILPDEVEKFPWAGHLGTKLLHKILPIIEESTTTLLFTNTRSQAEIWYQKILEAAPELSGLVAMHHGSIDNNIRAWVEDAIHEGRLKLVVCTSSLDLGVDFRPVETVIQVGGPKGIARFLQRAGRSGHHPGATSKIFFLPTHSLELIEASALKSAIAENKFESRIPLQKSFDVLVQYLVTLAVGEGFEEDKVYNEIKSTYAFHQITKDEWQWALNFIIYGGKSLTQYDEFQKVDVINGRYVVSRRRIAIRHRLSIGTIVADPVLKVKYLHGGFIGTVEESFISRLKNGDRFWFAGRNLEFIRIKDLIVLVKASNKKSGTIPKWMGGRMPLSSQLSEKIRDILESASNNDFYDIELQTLQPLFQLQAKWSVIPKKNILLIEKLQSKEGFHIFFYPFEGRLVHEILSALVAYRISRIKPLTFSIAMNDYGFELLSDNEIPIEEALEYDLFSKDNLLEDIHNSINDAELAKRKFRDIATIAGLIFLGFPGKGIKDKHLHATSQILYDVFTEYDPNNLLIEQATHEVMNIQLEQSRLMEALKRINLQVLTIINPPRTTPFAFPIMVDRLREKLSSEKLEDRINKMQVQLEKWAQKE